ncbi:MAG: nuclear transport factor 2 family protein [Spirulina sp. SIO3F2]|nr:nuclear transport factor 2 family protein [Spirulina sp. SIO3F2]
MGNFAIRRTATSFLLGLTLLGFPKFGLLPAQARDAAIAQALNDLESAANAHDVDAVMAYYGESFTHSDGLSRQMLADGLTDLWEQYSGIQYDIEVEDWDEEGETVIAHTVTRVSGSRYEGTRPIRLEAEIESRQYFDRTSQQILRQDVLAERTLILSGVNPPDVDINLPQEVGIGDTFDFDVIVQEPLQGELLLGGALEAPVSYEEIAAIEAFELELLQAGGIFKRGTAPQQPDDQWLSAIVIREDGITMLTQRLRIR